MFLWKVLKIFFKNIMARRLHVYVTLNQLLFTCKMQEHFIVILSNYYNKNWFTVFLKQY